MSGKVQDSLRQLANFYHHLQCAGKHTRSGYSQAARSISKKRAMILYAGSDGLTLLEQEMKPCRIVGKKKDVCLSISLTAFCHKKSKIFASIFLFLLLFTKTETPSYSLWNPNCFQWIPRRGNRRKDRFC